MAHSLTIQQAEAEVRDFAASYPTPNVKRAIKLAEEGTLSWFDLYKLCTDALSKAVSQS